MTSITMKALLETGVHFGHRTRKWNPKMKPYIFTERNGIHILDLHQTLKAIKDCYDLVRDSVANGGSLMLVGTKRQAQDTIAREAARCAMPYVNERWLGGTLTNWRTIRHRIDYLKELEARQGRGEFDLLTKKEALILTREMEKLNMRLGGIREMKSLPSLVFVVDVRREHTAIHEANILNIPVLAMVDTNNDPEMVDYVIPANDDAIRAIKLVTSIMADAVLEGVSLRKDTGVEEVPVEEVAEVYGYREGGLEAEAEVSDEEFLGEATLRKLRSGVLEFEEEEAKKEVMAEASTAEVETPVIETPVEEAPAQTTGAKVRKSRKAKAQASDVETPEEEKAGDESAPQAAEE